MDKTKWQSYPRPQLKREGYKILNGRWKLGGRDIRIPFPPQSRLSDYIGKVGEQLVYETTFTIPREFGKPCIRIHFGAVDEVANVYVNDTFVGQHEGGYLHFSFDITKFIKRDKENKLRVEVTDTLNTKYPYGKQSKKRGGMWYTPISGIWQTVWLENLSENPIEEIKIIPSLDSVEVQLSANTKGFNAVVTGNNKIAAQKTFEGNTGRLIIKDPVNWTTENPYLYDLRITTMEDDITSYFALRTVEIKRINGVNRVCLNGKPIFMHGVLDQGYFEDGIYLPKSENEFEQDILHMKELGYNMLRKHIKIEPEAFYYACDHLGMLVMQDMVNNGGYSYLFDTVLPNFGFKKRDDTKGRYTQDAQTQKIFEQHMKDTIHDLYNHPCIIAYTIFNEGWGQFHSDRMYEIAKSMDSTRLYDTTSGWFAQNKSDFDSEHVYFRNISLQPKERPMFLTECGGFSYLVKGHVFNPEKTYGYGTCKSVEELTDRIIAMYETMVLPSIKDGLCGCVYTQLSDVEDEINGMYTYDRQICKVNKTKMQNLAARITDQLERNG